MTNPWLPWPLALAWAAAFALLVAVHLQHAGAASGWRQSWLGGHALMAAGMVVMYLPTSPMLVSATTGAVVFALAATGQSVGLVVSRIRGAGVGLLWVIGAVDLVWMAYMFGAMHRPVAAWSLLGVVWFAAQALAWAARAFAHADARSFLHSDARVMRVSMTVMSVGMAYMLLVMQFGPGPSPAAPGVHH